jgi:membrane-bound serine protease (ClpP class)
MERKRINDAVAYIQGLARLRGRNAEWAESAVRDGVSLTAEDALDAGVVDLVTPDLGSLLMALDGRAVVVRGEDRVLRTEGISVKLVEPGWLTEFLATITHPNISYLLLLLGVYGIYFELSNPGAVLPGVLGSIALLLALYAFQILPVNFAGLGLLLLGLAFMVAEAILPSFGALGLGGALAFVFGSMMLMDTQVDAYRISPYLIATLAAGSAVALSGITALMIQNQRRAVVSGVEAMVGQPAEALEPFDSRGWVFAFGESWSSRSRTPVARGERLRILAVTGLTLEVEPWKKEG